MTASGAPLDHTKAIHWFGEAAEQGLAGAQCNFGQCFEASADYHQAVKWYEYAALQGHLVAKKRLADLLHRMHQSPDKPTDELKLPQVSLRRFVFHHHVTFCILLFVGTIRSLGYHSWDVNRLSSKRAWILAWSSLCCGLCPPRRVRVRVACSPLVYVQRTPSNA
jgi:hypothetical protein